MTEIELELMRLRTHLAILETLVLKHSLLTAMQSGLTLDEATQATLRSLELSDDTVRDLFAGVDDPAQVALRESELREIVERMKSSVLRLQKGVNEASSR